MTFMYLNEDTREIDYFLSDAATAGVASVEVDLSDGFIERYKEAVNNYDGVQAELELIFKSKGI